MTETTSKRLFIAVDVPPAVNRLVPLIRTLVHTPNREVRWVASRNLHLTLSFLGQVDDTQIPDLVTALHEAICTQPFDGLIQGTGVFPDISRPRVLWLGLSQGAESLLQLQESVDQAALSFKEFGKLERFHPHITIGRVGPRVHPNRLNLTQFLSSEYEPIALNVKTVKLVESQLFPTGAQYSVVKTYLLSSVADDDNRATDESIK